MRSILICAALVETFISPAFAHTGSGQTASFVSGIEHPFSGTDHIVAMVAVGLWAVLSGGRAIWIWPAVFPGTMLAGFAAANLGLPIPFVEPAIASSVVVLGLLVALAVQAPMGFGAVIVGLIAFFHGHAHGSEVAGSLIPYAAGFALATATLHVAGIGLGYFARGSAGKVALRALGGLAALGGIALLAG
jgi:urease accessory protein